MKDKVKNLQLIIILRSFFQPLISFSLFSLEHKNIPEMFFLYFNEIVIFPWNDITIILFIIKIIMMTTIEIIFIVIIIINMIRSIVLLANAWGHSYKCPWSSKLCYALIGWLHLMLFFLISAWKPLGWYRRPVGFVDWCFSYDRGWNFRVYKQLVNLPVFKAFRQIDLLKPI